MPVPGAGVRRRTAALGACDRKADLGWNSDMTGKHLQHPVTVTDLDFRSGKTRCSENLDSM